MTKQMYVIGSCMEMCPIEEQKLRTRENLIHVLEQGRSMVKRYIRSAAGLEMTKPQNIRPPQVLDSTITYLFNNILLDKNYKFTIIYDFINDRLRSIKQDLFIQQAPSEQCFPILEPMVRFYVYSSYRLGNENRNNFDTTLNHNQLLEILKWLLKEYSTICHISESRIEMESLYVLLNLGEQQAIMRSLELNKTVRQCLVQKCEELSLSWYIGNYARIFKNIQSLPILHRALLCAYQLPYIRRFALNVMNTAYSSKNLTVPISTLVNLLLYNNEDELLLECSVLGLRLCDKDIKAVQFSKTSWKAVNDQPKFFELNSLNELFKATYLPELLLNVSI